MNKELIWRGVKTGTAITAATATAMMVAAGVERGSPWAGFNAMATAVGARRVPDDFDMDVTPLGFGVLAGGLLLWGGAYEAVLSAVGRRSTLLTGVASGLGGYLVDRLLLPRRLVPAFRSAMGVGGVFAKYAALALASAASRGPSRRAARSPAP
jgi:hypothetical protein